MIKGPKDYYKHGDWNAICDVCGFKYKASELRRRWDGLMVCSSDFEQRHPQDLLRPRRDNPAVPWTRPEQGGTTELAAPSDPLTITGEVNPSVGDQYAASGGFWPYIFTISAGTINRTTGVIEDLTGVLGAQTVTVTDGFGNVATFAITVINEINGTAMYLVNANHLTGTLVTGTPPATFNIANQEVGIDAGASYGISGFTFKTDGVAAASAVWRSDADSTFDVYTSANNLNWTLHAEVIRPPIVADFYGSGLHKVTISFTAVTARYVKVVNGDFGIYWVTGGAAQNPTPQTVFVE